MSCSGKSLAFPDGSKRWLSGPAQDGRAAVPSQSLSPIPPPRSILAIRQPRYGTRAIDADHPKTDPGTDAIAAFILRWEGASGSERAN
jgi:hypothetical protein